MHKMHGTTILCVRHKGRVVMAGDGQVTLEHTIMKHTAKKVRTTIAINGHPPFQSKMLVGSS